MKQILLKGSGYSGRGVRITVLEPTQVESIREETAKDIPSDPDMSDQAKNLFWSSRQKAIGIRAMVTEVTTKAGFATSDQLLADTVEWKKVSADHLTENLGVYFTTKDVDALGDIYFKFHVANGKEVEDILGEALDVTAA